MPTEATFSYSTAPLPVKPRRKFRDLEEEDGPKLITTDPRVIRGNTHAMARNLATIKKQNEAITLQKTLQLKKAYKPREVVPAPSYSFDVPGFVSSALDLSLYLVDHDTSRKDVKVAQTQVDEFDDRPPTPEYVPKKTGIDKETQVEDVNELFNFDVEVEPMLEVIVKKTLEQALFEVQAEDELKSLEAAAVHFHREQQLEQEWMLDKEREYAAEAVIKANHLVALRANQERQLEVKRKVAGTRCMRELYSTMLEEAAEELYAEGTWKVSEREDIANRYIPLAVVEGGRAMQRYGAAQALVDELLSAAERLYSETPQFVPPSKPRRILVRVVLSAETLGEDATEDLVLGPFDVSEVDTVGAVEGRIRSEIRRRKIQLEPPKQGFFVSALRIKKALPAETPLRDLAIPDDSLSITV